MFIKNTLIIGRYIYDLASGTVTKFETPESLQNNIKGNAYCFFTTVETKGDANQAEWETDKNTFFNLLVRNNIRCEWIDKKNNLKYIYTGKTVLNTSLKLDITKEDVDIDILVLALDYYKDNQEKKMPECYTAFVYVALSYGYYGGKYNIMSQEGFINQFHLKIQPSSFSEYKNYCQWVDGKIKIDKEKNAKKYEEKANNLIQEVLDIYKQLRNGIESSNSSHIEETIDNLP